MLEELLEENGWIRAEDAGRVTDCRLKVGERIQDGACILYARLEGEQILEATFSEEQAEYISQGQSFEMYGDNRILGDALLENLERQEDGRSCGRFSVGEAQVSMGQKVQLICRIRTDVYDSCISPRCLYQEGEGRYYVYVAEEREGILGTEWKVRRVRVDVLDQNDSIVAIRSPELTEASKIVSVTDKELYDGQVVRALQ